MGIGCDEGVEEVGKIFDFVEVVGVMGGLGCWGCNFQVCLYRVGSWLVESFLLVLEILIIFVFGLMLFLEDLLMEGFFLGLR